MWDASDRDDQLVEALALLLALGVDIVDGNVLLRSHLRDVYAELDREALLREKLPRLLRDLLVGGA